ncbi:SH3 domain-containing protein [Bdellovibrio sp. NC01]|uniref:SH3 domain-containing protein n=1 Tax=Bdellovibrio sp. NC01 TaxID=2220073 RepID=UPI0011570893|nr:SH3 domain-containing protein [Bdellovibrio sp. NC01]QDK37415.1 SH3 domain-containing protein [Bdellovibrio sp. NC01]
MKFIALILFFILPVQVFAQTAQQGTIVADEAQIYRDPDFDAPVIAVLPPGGVYSISTGKKGPFFKIRVKPGTVGWISETDIRPGNLKVTAETKKEAQKLKEQKEHEENRPAFFTTRHWGPVVEFLNYTEDTMGEERSAMTMFYGFKWTGFNTLFSGEVYTDANLIFHSGAPSYYEDKTGESAGGFIVNANFLLQTVRTLTKDCLMYYGFGPTWRYSHFDLHLNNGGVSQGYSADDMALGILFDVGLAYRISKTAIRSDVKYYWEKNKYPGIGVSWGFEF